MNLPLTLATTLAAAALTITPAPAEATHVTPCPGPAATDAEWSRVHHGQRAIQVFVIIGGVGKRVTYGDPLEEIRDFPYCGERDEFVPGVRVRFGRNLDGSWTVTDTEVL